MAKQMRKGAVQRVLSRARGEAPASPTPAPPAPRPAAVAPAGPAELVEAFWSVGPGHLWQLGDIAEAARREGTNAESLRLIRFSVPRAELSGGTTAGRQEAVRDLLDHFIQEAN